MRRPQPSLARRLTIGFCVSNAVAVLLFTLFALYPAALMEEDEALGPELPPVYLQRDLEFDAAGALRLRNHAEILDFVKVHPGTWFVAQSGARQLAFGPVPTDVPARIARLPGAAFQARYHDLGTTGPAGEALTTELDVDGRKVTVTGGGIISADINFPQFLTYIWRSYFFWAPVFTAAFNLVGGFMALPIILRSVRSTARAAEALDPGDLSKRLPEQGVVRELRPMVRAFNAALDRSAAAFERRRRFIADLAHELRTPLAVLNMHVEALPDESVKLDLQRTVFRLSQMVGQMLDSERLSLAGRERVPVDLVVLARAAVADVAPLAVANGYEIALTAASAPVIVDGDPHAIARALTNLLGNAVAHGGGSGGIEVRVVENGWIDVADPGPGVPAVARQRIFEPFHRERWDKDGCGLGLHLVNEVMQAHDGRVHVVDAGPGATFRMEFPMK